MTDPTPESPAHSDPHYPALGALDYGNVKGSLYGQPDPHITEWIARYPAGTHLDLAAGDGRYTPFLALADRLLTADRDAAALAAIRHKNPRLVDVLRQIVLDVFAPLPFAAASIDVTLCTGLLYLYPFETLLPVFAELRRISRPNAVLIFDFATEIERLWLDGKPVHIPNETRYSYENGLQTIRQLLNTTQFHIDATTLTQIDEMLPAGYRIRNRKINVLALAV